MATSINSIPSDIRSSLEKLDYYDRLKLYNYIQNLLHEKDKYEQVYDAEMWRKNPSQGAI